MRKLLALGAAAALTLIGVGTASTAAQADEIGTTQFSQVKISEVLINTVEPTQSTLGGIYGVEVIKPTSGAQNDLTGYRIEACGATSVSPTTVATLNSTTVGKDRIAAADKTGWTINSAALNTMDAAGGVRIVDASGGYVDAVTFNPANALVLACLTTGAPAGTIPDSSPAPNATQSATRISDINQFELRAPTFQQVNGAPNPTS